MVGSHPRTARERKKGPERNVDEEEEDGEEEERRKNRCFRGQRCSVVTWRAHKVTLWSRWSVVTVAALVRRAGSPSAGSPRNSLESSHTRHPENGQTEISSYLI